ncbi:hypothetical protein [Breznakia pachnodae]|uniref:Uncharacterized protein n=1 Tax=Breznakia pachnodae TaxID=265178 RepID=A0ABU0E405_9FIRM|nr:hypothetical protein [Breznakia pachnodae]MDQ0361615.1 hypothetical protein [Breznakia pachnodae]
MTVYDVKSGQLVKIVKTSVENELVVIRFANMPYDTFCKFEENRFFRNIWGWKYE